MSPKMAAALDLTKREEELRAKMTAPPSGGGGGDAPLDLSIKKEKSESHRSDEVHSCLQR